MFKFGVGNVLKSSTLPSGIGLKPAIGRSVSALINVKLTTACPADELLLELDDDELELLLELEEELDDEEELLLELDEELVELLELDELLEDELPGGDESGTTKDGTFII